MGLFEQCFAGCFTGGEANGKPKRTRRKHQAAAHAVPPVVPILQEEPQQLQQVTAAGAHQAQPEAAHCHVGRHSTASSYAEFDDAATYYSVADTAVLSRQGSGFVSCMDSFTSSHSLQLAVMAHDPHHQPGHAYAHVRTHTTHHSIAATHGPHTGHLSPVLSVQSPVSEQHAAHAAAATAAAAMLSSIAAGSLQPHLPPKLQRMDALVRCGPSTAEQALQMASELYNQQGLPCDAINVLLDYSKHSGTPIPDLETLLQKRHGGNLHMERLVEASASLQIAPQVLKDDAGWQVVRDDDLKLMYKQKADSTVHCFKGRCTLDAPIDHFVAIAREFDLCKTWNRYVVESVMLEEYSVSEALAVAVLWLPWPFNNMNLVVEAVGIDMLDDHGGFVVTLHSPEQRVSPEQWQKVPEKQRRNPRLHLCKGSTLFFEPLPPKQPGGPMRTRATMEAHVDTRMKKVPSAIITFVLKVLAPFVHKMVVQLMTRTFKDPTAPLPSRIPLRPDLYGMVRARAVQYLAKLTGAGAMPAAHPAPATAAAAAAAVKDNSATETVQRVQAVSA